MLFLNYFVFRVSLSRFKDPLEQNGSLMSFMHPWALKTVLDTSQASNKYFLATDSIFIIPFHLLGI